MKPLRPHPLHPPSLRILLGLDLPPTVATIGGAVKVTNIDFIEVDNTFLAEEKKRFCDAAAEYIRNGVFDAEEIILSIEADEFENEIEIIPRGVKTGRTPSRSYLKKLIGTTRKRIGLGNRPTKSEMIVFLALSGKTREEVRRKKIASPSLITDVFNTLGLYSNRKNRPETPAHFVKLCHDAKNKFYEAQGEQ